MRHKATVAGAAAVAALSLLAACSDASESGDSISGDIQMWTYPLASVNDPSWYQTHIDRFNERYPDVDVEVIVQPWSNREERIVTAITGDNAPDVIYLNPGYVANLGGQDLLLPLDDLRSDWDMFAERALEAGTQDGTLYGSPLLIEFQSSYCNTQVLAAAGVDCPTTWDEMREVAPAVQDAGYYLTEYSGTNTLNHTFYRYLWQAGGEVLSGDMTEAAFNGPEGLRALEFIAEMAENEWIPQELLAVEQSFEQSAVGREQVAYVMGANLHTTREVVNPDIIHTVPPMRDEEQVAVGSVGALSIFNSTDAPDAARAWVHFLTEPEFLKDFLPAAGFLSPRSDVTGLFPDDPQMAEGEEYLDLLRTDVPHAEATRIMNLVRPHLQRVLLEGADPQAALDAAADEVNGILADSE